MRAFSHLFTDRGPIALEKRGEFRGRAKALAGGLVLLAVAIPLPAAAQTLKDFAVLAGSTVTNTGSTVISGNIGVDPGLAITGQSDISQTNGTYHAGDGVAVQAQSDLATTYGVLMGLPATTNLSGVDLGTQNLSAGVYKFDTSAQLTGTLHLSGDANSVFVIQIGSTLTTASGSSIELDGAVNPANVFFVVGSSATLGTTTDFKGQIVALTSISLNTHATIDCGAAWARNGAVTLQSNTINICTFTVASGSFSSQLEPTASDESKAVAKVLDDAATGGTPLPIGFGVLSLLSPTEQDTAYDQISGETATGVSPAIVQQMDAFLDVARNFQRGGANGGSPTGGDTGSPAGSGPATVSVMGYASSAAPAANGAFAAFDRPVADVAPDLRLHLWAAGFGDYSRVAGDAAAGTHDRTAQGGGIAAGLDNRIDADTEVGIAIGAASTRFEESGGLGNGHLTSGDVALYGRKDFDRAYLSGLAAYGYSLASTSRYVTFAGIDNLTAQFTAQDLAAQLEAGYQLGLFTPYAAIRGDAVRTPGHGESAAPGNSTFALSYDGSTVLTTRSEVGIKVDWLADLDGGSIGLHGSAAWAHEVDSGTMTAAFEEVPGSTFALRGAAAAANSLLLAARVEMAFAGGVSLAGSINSKLARNAQSYGGNLHIGYSWQEAAFYFTGYLQS